MLLHFENTDEYSVKSEISDGLSRMDTLDRKILQVLQTDSRTSLAAGLKH
ncbi:hypothetical protein ABLV49_01970 [Polaromonas hydrogenivorans]|uniref:HTH asnC-type domain-containing protein n=1 Tax=Polaromonas hydrogenivorans TaxID=335476 RepID=A0AAU7LUQ0_9BURK